MSDSGQDHKGLGPGRDRNGKTVLRRYLSLWLGHRPTGVRIRARGDQMRKGDPRAHTHIDSLTHSFTYLIHNNWKGGKITDIKGQIGTNI